MSGCLVSLASQACLASLSNQTFLASQARLASLRYIVTVVTIQPWLYPYMVIYNSDFDKQAEEEG
jgi:hypothetical protein